MEDLYLSSKDFWLIIWGLVIGAIISWLFKLIWPRIGGYRVTSVPLWTVVATGIYVMTTLTIGFIIWRQQTGKLELIQGRRFVKEWVEMDGKRFVDCDFVSCRMVFRGRREYDILNNKFDTTCVFRFADRANTVMVCIAGLRQMAPLRVSIDSMMNRFTKEGYKAGELVGVWPHPEDTLYYTKPQ